MTELFTTDVCGDTFGWHCFVDDGCLNHARCFSVWVTEGGVRKKHVMVKRCVVQLWTSSSVSSN